MPILKGISFEDLQVKKQPAFKGFTVEQYHQPVRFRLRGISFEGEGVSVRLKITDKVGTPISAAQCKITSTDFLSEGETTAEGIVAFDYVVNADNILIITKEGYKVYQHKFNYETFTEIDWWIKLDKAVSSLHDLSGNVYVPAKADDPENNVITQI